MRRRVKIALSVVSFTLALASASPTMFVASHGTVRAFMETATIIGLDIAKRSF
jgi:hypothetical protein